MKTLISGGTVVTPKETRVFNILIEGEKIAALVDSGVSVVADKTIDATGHIILPGAIDGHTHFCPLDPLENHPSELDDEGFYYGGCGAAAGGVTTIIEMPQGYPPTISKETFERKRIVGQDDAIVDFAMWGGITPGITQSVINQMLEAGAVGFKAYTCNDDPDLPMISDFEMVSTLQALNDTGTMQGIHTENEGLLREFTARIKDTGRTDPLAYAESRPPILEAIDVNRVIFMAEHTGGWAHIVHLSSVESAELVRRAKARGVRVTAETCPQYLALDLEDLKNKGSFAKCVPPLRSRENVEKLWDYLADGTIDCVTTDHCGWTRAAKEKGLWEAPNGLSGIQTFLPILISEALSRGFSWVDIASWTAGNPAKLWNISHRKGAIQAGADADLVIIKENVEWEVEPDKLLHAQKWSPFEGKKLNVKIKKTLLRGVTIFDDQVSEKILVKPGFGQFIPSAR
jgi:allantoinase